MITVGHRSVVPPGLYPEANMLQSRSLQKLGHQLRKIGDQSLDYLADRREGMIHFCGDYMKECWLWYSLQQLIGKMSKMQEHMRLVLRG